MSPEKVGTLEKLLGSLGLHDAVKELSGTEAVHQNVPQQTANDDALNIDKSNIEGQQSFHQLEAISATTSFPELTSGTHGPDDGFGSDLQPWNSHVSTEVSPSSVHIIDYSNNANVHSLPASLNNQATGSQVSLAPENDDEHDVRQIGDSGSSDESLVDELSHRVGTLMIGPTGRTKLYGPSSILDVERTRAPGPPEGQSAHLSHVAHLSAQSQEHTKLPEELHEHLTNRFFVWENPFSDFVDRATYTLARARSQRGQDTPWYSRALCHAV